MYTTVGTKRPCPQGKDKSYEPIIGIQRKNRVKGNKGPSLFAAATARK